ncbi:MAG: hypothetical protein AAGF12_16780 [Myxococcota bacterium]
MRGVAVLVGLLAGCVSSEADILVLGPSAGAFNAIRVDPPNAQIVVENGEPGRVALTAFGIRSDGSETRLAAVDAWNVRDDEIGFVDDGGLFTAEGPAGGLTRVVARLGPDRDGVVHQAGADITVDVQWTIAGPELEPELVERALQAPEGDGSLAPTVLHPLDGAEVPEDLPLLDVHWTSGPGSVDGETAVYVVTLRGTHAQVTYVLEESDVSNLRLEEREKMTLLETTTGDRIEVRVGRLDAEVIHRSSPVTFRAIPGALLSDIVYFDESGRLLAVEWTQARRATLLPSPPSRDADRCVGCHTIDPDGERFVAALYSEPREGFVFSFDADLTRDPAESEPISTEDAFGFSTLTPDGEVIATVGGHLRAYAPFDDEELPWVLPTEPATQPTLTPDGERLVYVAADDIERFTTGDLRVAEVADDGFGAPRTLVQGADLSGRPEGGSALAHPTFAPDPRWLVFAHGPSSWLGPENAPSEAALYLSVEEQTPVRLDNLLPEGTASATWPRFASRLTGEGNLERFWLVFLSRAPFGNESEGTRESLRRQLWLASIDPNAPPGTDPSHAPLRVPMQSRETHNLGAAFRSLECVEFGETCAASSQCCAGVCRPDDEGFLSCD